jgi:ABC-type multidrug transport system ATPase subunit
VREIFHDISLDISAGDIHLITGPSGVGKSTLLSILGGIVPPQSGSMTYHTDLSPRAHAFGYALIDGPFFESLTARDNISLLTEFAHIPYDVAHYEELVSYFDIGDIIDQTMDSLSA